MWWADRSFHPPSLHHILCCLFGRYIYFFALASCVHIETVFLVKSSSLCGVFFSGKMFFSPKFSLSNIHVRLTAKGLLRNLQLLSGCKSTVVFQAGLFLRERSVDVPFPSFCTVILCSSQGAILAHVVLILSLDGLSLPKSILYLYMASRHLLANHI